MDPKGPLARVVTGAVSAMKTEGIEAFTEVLERLGHIALERVAHLGAHLQHDVIVPAVLRA
jgi:hypothetical protein